MARRVQQKLTDAVIRNVAAANPVERRDHVVVGLYVRVSPTQTGHSRVWKLDTRTQGGRRKPVTLGRWPEMDCAAARAAARELRGEVETGAAVVTARDENPALGRFLNTWVEDMQARGQLKSAPKMAAALRANLPENGDGLTLATPVRSITTAMVTALQTEVARRTSASNANKVIPYLTSVLNYAVRLGVIEENPASIGKGGRIDKLPEPFRPARHFTPEEWARLDATLDDSSPAWFADLCRVAVGSGARLGELLALPWTAVDLDRGTVTFEAATTKDSEPRTVPVSSLARATLKARHRTNREGHALVFHHANSNRVSALMDAALEAAGVEKEDGDGRAVSFKSFRTTFASWIVQRTGNLLAVSKLLGHRGMDITARHYAHLVDDDLAHAVAVLD